MNELPEENESSSLSSSGNKNEKNLQLSSNIPQDTHPELNSPSMQNINNLILSCVKNDEYCSSMMDFFKKMIHVKQIDYYMAFTNILYCFKPKEINETAKVRKHLKNKYSRDDPGFLIILILDLFISSICYSMVYGHFNPFFIFNIFFIQTFLMLFTSGILIALVCKVVIDKYFRNDEIGTGKEQRVEYLYAFDIHCNSFVPFYFFTAVIPFCLLPIVNGKGNFLKCFISNTLTCIGVLYYFYVTFLAYFALPFVRKNKFVTLTIWPILGFFVFMSILKVNVFNYFVILLYK
ncbi:MAG: unc-50 family protein [archaeon]|nr:unc-50 family protein [archaeon]